MSRAGDGRLALPGSVQTHLKAEIALVLATETTGEEAYARAAYSDLKWVILNRMETNGGLNWRGAGSSDFFEVHQHWFLIASELIQKALGRSDSLAALQRSAWAYLLGDNPGVADFYEDNREKSGAFFAYRSIDRRGRFQSQAPFKGSYEIGAALWSLSLHRESEPLAGLSSASENRTVLPREYLYRLVGQVIRDPEEGGFYDDQRGLWVRCMRWTDGGWRGWDEPDLKYTLHMEEGALQCILLTGERRLLDPARSQLEFLIALIPRSGKVLLNPSERGAETYEYGLVMSTLGLGARVFREEDPHLSRRSLQAGEQVLAYCLRTFAPKTDEGGAMLLAGLCQVARAMQELEPH